MRVGQIVRNKKRSDRIGALSLREFSETDYGLVGVVVGVGAGLAAAGFAGAAVAFTGYA